MSQCVVRFAHQYRTVGVPERGIARRVDERGDAAAVRHTVARHGKEILSVRMWALPVSRLNDASLGIYDWNEQRRHMQNHQGVSARAQYKTTQ